MLRMQATGAESLWDEILPVEVKALPDDLARLDALLADPALLAPIRARWERLLSETGRTAGRGRPTIGMETYVRLMVIKHRSGWGYETLMREVSDSMHLRRFCRIGMSERVPDESTVRKLTRRLGPGGGARDHARGDRRRPGGRSGFARGRRGSTRPSWRPTSAIRPMPGSRQTGSGRWRARDASSR